MHVGSVAALALGALAACANDPPKAQPAPVATTVSIAHDGDVNPRLLRRFKAVQAPADPPDAVASLGRTLFNDVRLSDKGELSCASCHPMDHFGADGHVKDGKRNTPTVLNAALAFTQFWDGRSGTLEEQARGPLFDKTEMGMASPEALVARLGAIPDYVAAFGAAFPAETRPITIDNVTHAIAAYERRLVTPSRWDRFLNGEATALSPKEKTGLKTFLNSGCMVCHTGPLLGGSTFERLGVVEPWPNQTDLGRMEVTHAKGDRMSFKVPTLRNVAKTAPYFHDGSSADLSDAVRRMGRHQLGIDLGDDEVDSIVAWLGALTGASADTAPASQMKIWMKANAAPAIANGSFDALGAAFVRMHALDPKDAAYPEWSRYADAGSSAAKAHDLEGCRDACRSCHDAYRSAYRARTSQDSSAVAVRSPAAQ